MNENKVISLRGAARRYFIEGVLFGLISAVVLFALIAPTVARWTQ